MSGNKVYSKKILLVDADAITQIAVTAILDNSGCYVESANSEDEALAILSNKKFDAILVDISKMDGYALTKSIRTSEKGFKNILIVGMLPNARPPETRKAISYGMNYILSKPIDIKKLKHILHELNVNELDSNDT